MLDGNTRATSKDRSVSKDGTESEAEEERDEYREEQGPVFRKTICSRASVMQLAGEKGMASLINAHVGSIMKPVLDRLDGLELTGFEHANKIGQFEADMVRVTTFGQSLEKRICDCCQDVRSLYEEISDLKVPLEENRSSIRDLRIKTEATNNDLTGFIHKLENEPDGILTCIKNDLRVHEQRLDSIEFTLAHQDKSGEMECFRQLNLLKESVLELQAGRQFAEAEFKRLQADLELIGLNTNNLAIATEQTAASVGALQNCVDSVVCREAQLAVQLNAWKDQWSKLHPELQAVVSKTAHLARRSEHHDAALHCVQQGIAQNSTEVRELGDKHGSLEVNSVEMSKKIESNLEFLASVSDSVDRVMKQGNGLHTRLEENLEKLLEQQGAIDSLGQKTEALSGDVEFLKDSMSAVQTEQGTQSIFLQRISNDLGGVNTTINILKQDQIGLNRSIQDLIIDNNNTKACVERLAETLDVCTGSLNGLQKGFQAIGNHVQKRSSHVVLPSLDYVRPVLTSSGTV